MVLGGVLVFVVVGGITLVVVLLRNPQTRAQIDAMRAGIGAVMAGQQAPGTDELRAAGCETATVIDWQRAFGHLRPKADAGEPAAVGPGGAVVMCTAGMLTSLTCERLAEIYGRAVSPDAPFSVMMRVSPRGLVCSGRFAADGTRLGDVPSSRRPG